MTTVGCVVGHITARKTRRIAHQRTRERTSEILCALMVPWLRLGPGVGDPKPQGKTSLQGQPQSRHDLPTYLNEMPKPLFLP